MAYSVLNNASRCNEAQGGIPTTARTRTKIFNYTVLLRLHPYRVVNVITILRGVRVRMIKPL